MQQSYLIGSPFYKQGTTDLKIQTKQRAISQEQMARADAKSRCQEQMARADGKSRWQELRARAEG
jgi:hypothetical protein